MAIVNSTRLQGLDDRLTDVLHRLWPHAEGLAVSDAHLPSSSGMSNETIRLHAAWTEQGAPREGDFVVRLQPPGPGIYPEYDVLREGRVLTALAGVDGVPVPTVLLAEADPAPLGAPFLLMEAVPGRGPADDPPYTAAGWVLELPENDRARVCDEALRVMARLHAVDWRALGLGFLERPELGPDPLSRRLAWERRFHDWATGGERHELVEAAFDWLDRHRPAQPGDAVLNWGDGRISNVIYGPDLSPAAVVDFEVAALAPAECDLGWHLFSARHHTDGIGVPRPDGFPTVEQTIARYEELTCRPVRDIEFYEVLAGVRGATMMVRAARMLTEAGALPPGNTMAVVNPATTVLAGLIGAPAPTGESISFIGNRG
jgi:aminoglycoside phosphotransferase (APT) family kinase protein